MTDWNMLRLLYGAKSASDKSQIFCLECLEETKDAQHHKAAAMRFQATLLKSVGVKLVVAGDNYDDVWQVLAEHVTSLLPPFAERDTKH